MKRSPNADRRSYVALAAIVAVAVLLRLPSLLHDGLWRDQANVYVQITAPSFHQFLQRVIATEWHPPLYFFIAYAWARIAGTGEIAMTIVPFCLSILTVVAVFRLGTIAANARAGLIAAAIYGVSPLAFSYATEYLYPLAALSCTILAALVVEAVVAPRAPRLWAIACASALAVYSHYTALLFVPLLALWVLWQKGLRGGAKIVAALVAGAATFAFWMPEFLMQRGIGVPYAEPTTLAEKALYVWQALGDLLPSPYGSLRWLWLAAILGAAAAIARTPSRTKGSCAMAAIVIVMLLVLTSQNLLTIRYIFPAYGVFCASLGALFACVRGWRRWTGVATAVAALVVVGTTNAVYAARVSAVPKSGMRTLASARGFSQTALYVVAPDYLASTFAYYARDAGAHFTGFVRADEPQVFALENYARDWNDPRAIARSLSLIRAQAARYRFVDVIIDVRAHDQGHVPYGRSWALVRALQQRMPLVERMVFPGRYETIADYRFAVSSAACGRYTRRASVGCAGSPGGFPKTTGHVRKRGAGASDIPRHPRTLKV